MDTPEIHEGTTVVLSDGQVGVVAFEPAEPPGATIVVTLADGANVRLPRSRIVEVHGTARR